MNIKNLKKTAARAVIALLAAAGLVAATGQETLAATRYSSDGRSHSQGYIFISESHAVFCSQALPYNTDGTGKINGTVDAYYKTSLTTEALTSAGNANMFNMSGNVFFVFEGNDQTDGPVQLSEQYIYSDGKGGRGRGVQKIKEVMAANPNIAHWNIISWHGHGVARNETADGKYANAYVNSYRNWINSEFPGASVYFLSHGLKTKVFRTAKYADKINAAIKQNFPGNYLDFTSFLNARGERTIDGLHYDNDTYYTLITEVIKTIESGKKVAPSAATAAPAPVPAAPAAPEMINAGVAPQAPVQVGQGVFDASLYAALYPDLALNGIVTPQQLEDHYNNYGKKEGRIGTR